MKRIFNRIMRKITEKLMRKYFGIKDLYPDDEMIELDDTMLTDFDFGIAPDEWVKI